MLLDCDLDLPIAAEAGLGLCPVLNDRVNLGHGGDRSRVGAQESEVEQTGNKYSEGNDVERHTPRRLGGLFNSKFEVRISFLTLVITKDEVKSEYSGVEGHRNESVESSIIIIEFEVFGRLCPPVSHLHLVSWVVVCFCVDEKINGQCDFQPLPWIDFYILKTLFNVHLGLSIGHHCNSKFKLFRILHLLVHGGHHDYLFFRVLRRSAIEYAADRVELEPLR